MKGGRGIGSIGRNGGRRRGGIGSGVGCGRPPAGVGKEGDGLPVILFLLRPVHRHIVAAAAAAA